MMSDFRGDVRGGFGVKNRRTSLMDDPLDKPLRLSNASNVAMNNPKQL
jgi:hypothetical protein